MAEVTDEAEILCLEFNDHPRETVLQLAQRLPGASLPISLRKIAESLA